MTGLEIAHLEPNDANPHWRGVHVEEFVRGRHRGCPLLTVVAGNACETAIEVRSGWAEVCAGAVARQAGTQRVIIQKAGRSRPSLLVEKTKPAALR